MRPRKPDPTPQSDMFRESLEAILDPPDMSCCGLLSRIDWNRLDAHYGATFVEHVGRLDLPTRLMVGLHLYKHIKGLLDESVCAAWVENPYFRAPRAHVSGMRKRKEELNESRAFCCEGA